MSDKYILIYPFKSREAATEVANDINGSLMWQNGKAYPFDDTPAQIISIDRFNQQQAKIERLNKLLDKAVELIEFESDALPIISELAELRI